MPLPSAPTRQTPPTTERQRVTRRTVPGMPPAQQRREHAERCASPGRTRSRRTPSSHGSLPPGTRSSRRGRRQAEQHRRGHAAVPCVIPFFSCAWLHDALRRLRRFRLHGTAAAGLVLGAGAGWPGPAAGFAEAPLLAASGRAQPVLEIPAAPADARGAGPGLCESVMRREAVMASAASVPHGRSTTSGAASAAVARSPQEGTGAEHVRIDPKIERAPAMLDLGTTEGQLAACRLLHEHRDGTRCDHPQSARIACEISTAESARSAPKISTPQNDTGRCGRTSRSRGRSMSVLAATATTAWAAST